MRILLSTLFFPYFLVSAAKYEVWAPDQSNSVEGQDALGIRGGWLWIWDSVDIEEHLPDGTTPAPLPCSPDATAGPCDLFTIFPEELTDSDAGTPLSEAPGFGRWHGITKDPQNKYVTANIFAPGGGYIGIVDTETKGAVALFRVTEMTYSTGTDTTSTTRNVHMSFWNEDGSAILIHNLAGKALERINVERTDDGEITSATFDKGATLGFGKSMEVASEASFFEGDNAFGVPLLGAVTGTYDEAGLGDLTPTGHCKENGCTSVTADDTAAVMPGRPNNVPICPIVGSGNLVFNTFGGGGLLVVDSTSNPMSIVGAYGNSVVAGAGVCGEAVAGHVYLSSGVSASGAGADQSKFILYAFDPSLYTTDYTENDPAPTVVFDDPGSTDTTRRDGHDLTGTVDDKYVHVIDRIRNVVEVFDSATDEHVSTYDLTTATGMVGDGTVGPCGAASVTDGGDDFPTNDAAADFIEPTPDGKYMMLSFRGPAPVSATHAAQGSCPGVGVVELSEDGASGVLVGVLRSSHNTPDNIELISGPGMATYNGTERSDIHDVAVVFKEVGGEVDPESTTTSGDGEPGDGEPRDSGALVKAGLPFASFLVTIICFILSCY